METTKKSSQYDNLDDFKNRPLYVINLTRQPQNISESRNNIILHVDFDKNIEPPSGNNELNKRMNDCFLWVKSYPNLTKI